MEQSNKRRIDFITGSGEIPTQPVIHNTASTTGSPRVQPKTAASAVPRTTARPSAPSRPKTGRASSPRKSSSKKNTGLLALIGLIWLAAAAVLVLLIVYALRPQPLPGLLAVQVDYQPHYLFSIYGVDQPVGVAVSPRGDRIYAAESGGEHLVKMFNRRGDSIGSFSPPDTDATQRAPIYLALDKEGNVYVSDLQQLSVEVFDPEGKYLDSIIGPELTLGEYVALHNTIGQGATFSYNKFQDSVTIKSPGGEDTKLPAPGSYEWAPLGVRFDANGDLLLTDVIKDQHKVLIYPGDVLKTSLWQGGTLTGKFFGSYGSGNGSFLFPNVAVTDSKGRFYVTDGNNSRISVWDSQGAFLLNFGQGSGESAINLPRGAIMDDQDHLYVVDAVDHSIKVYDVSGDEISFLFRLGDYGGEDGQFNYPNDIAIDQTGRLYIADRENNRIEVWSY